jgi:dihydroflavonol-4-reductase
MLGEIARIVGRKAPRLKVPRAPLMPLAYGAEFIAKFTGKEPFVTLDGLRMSKYRMFFRTEKAERELGLKARPFAHGLEDAITWFRDAGYLTR